MGKPKVEISALGNPRVFYEGKDVSSKLSSKSMGILCFIAASESVNREKLAFMFWEDSSEESAKYNLRYNIWSMNKIFKNEKLNNALIVSNGSGVSFNGEYELVSDIEVFNGLHSKNEIEGSLEGLNMLREMYRGEFLEGFYLKGSFKFNDWIFFERENYQKKYIDSLNRLLAIYETEKNHMEGAMVLEELIRLNSLDEDLYVDLIKLYMDMGDRTSALKQYDRCIHILREELNISPKKSTENLLKMIKEARYVNNVEYSDMSTEYMVFLERNEFKRISASPEALDGLVVTTRCIPMEELDYNYISLLVDEIIVGFEGIVLENADAWIWKDLGKISLKALKYSKGEISTLSAETERNRIYQSVLELLLVASREQKINIFIENLQYMDRASYGFIKYLLFRKGGLNFTLYFTCQDNDSRMMELKSFYDF